MIVETNSDKLKLKTFSSELRLELNKHDGKNHDSCQECGGRIEYGDYFSICNSDDITIWCLKCSYAMITEDFQGGHEIMARAFAKLQEIDAVVKSRLT